MSNQKNYYDVLGISKSASEEEIKSAYKKMALKYHPDRNQGNKDAETKFKEVNEAYEILSDPQKKAMFDMYGTIDMNGANSYDGFDPFSGFNPFRRTQPVMERGQDLKITLNLEFDELFYGSHKKIKLNRKCACHRCNGSGSESNATCTCTKCGGTGIVSETRRYGNTIMSSQRTCPDCHGTGNMIKDPCPACNGTGLEDKQVDVEFDIPAGMYDSSYILLRGRGNEGPHRGIPGDLMVIVKEISNKHGLRRDENNNIICKIKASYKILVLGGDLKVPYINGTKLDVHVEPGSESGKIYKIPGKGFPDPNYPSRKGDYLVQLDCKIPQMSELTKTQVDLISKL